MRQSAIILLACAVAVTALPAVGSAAWPHERQLTWYPGGGGFLLRAGVGVGYASAEVETKSERHARRNVVPVNIATRQRQARPARLFGPGLATSLLLGAA